MAGDCLLMVEDFRHTERQDKIAVYTNSLTICQALLAQPPSCHFTVPDYCKSACFVGVTVAMLN